MGKSRRWLNTMRSLLISLVLLVLSVQADDFKGQKVTLGKRKCTCDFRLDMKEACKGTAKCDKKCSGAGKVEVGGCSFVLQVKKGAGKISKCACDVAQPTIGPVTGSGSGPQPPAGGESMQCGCKCDCPQGTGECDCDCNRPMNSQAVNCAPGFSKVCPMMGDQCPEYMEQVCPSMPTTMPLPAGRMMGAGDRGCQCVPDFLLSLVMGAMTPAGRSAAVDRAMTKVTFKIGKTTCKRQYEINPNDCKRSKMACDKKCNGKISGLELEDGNYVMSLMVKKGKVAIQKCEAKTTEPTGTGGGPGSGPGNGGESGVGSGPGSGMGGGMGGMGSRCACVSMGGGPMPPTGSGSGPEPPTGSGNESIETITRVRLELFHGQHDAGEPLSFDGQKITLPMDSQFNPSKPIKVVIHGWGQANLDGNGDVVADNDDYPHSFNQLYKSNGMDYTVLGVHWVPRDGWLEHLQTESSADAANTLGLLMRTLYNDFNIDTSQVHVIGFSMGTVVTSKTAKFIQQLGLPRFGRLTLLDPCPFHQASVISKTDAKFVEAIHTSSQDICSETPLAHVDFYPNGGDAQPRGSNSCSCPDGSLVCGTCFHGTARCVNFLGPDWVTNHMRAVELYRESIGRPSAFLSWRCSGTYEDFVAGDRVCIKNDQQQEVPMGEHSMDQGRPVDGLYFLTTSGESP